MTMHDEFRIFVRRFLTNKNQKTLIINLKGGTDIVISIDKIRNIEVKRRSKGIRKDVLADDIL